MSEDLYGLCGVFLISTLLTLRLIPKIIQISFAKKLFDFVDERKVHTSVVPRLGGVAFTPVIVISIAFVLGAMQLFWGWIPDAFYKQILHMLFGLTALLLLYIEGVCDDLIGVGYRWKFLIQLFCGILLAASGLWIRNLEGFLGIYALPDYVGMSLSVVLVVFIINAINLIDGIDGLASALSMTALIPSSVLLIRIGDTVTSLLALATIGTLIPFFGFNVFGKAHMHRKIFMGDAGSQTIGLILSMILISLANHPLYFNSESALVSSTLVLAYSFVIVPCFDVVRVMGVRILKKKNPFKPDLSHIHHRFLALGFSHHSSLLIILGIAVFFILLNGSLFMKVGITWVVLIDIILYSVLHWGLDKSIKRRKEKLKQQSSIEKKD